MQTADARKILTAIYKKHDLSTDCLLCNLFVEMDNAGEFKDPWIVGVAQNTLAMVNKKQAFYLFTPTLQYHLLPMDNVRLFVCCVHYKKMIVHTCKNNMYKLMMVTSDLSLQQLEEDWQLWSRLARHLQIREDDMKDNKGIKGSYKLNSKDKDPLLGLSFKTVDSCSFDQNAFHRWLQFPPRAESDGKKKKKKSSKLR
ncbi:uncharacterized protein CDAR_41231 [Caerostris darwini]|uniref:Uncharacterized protein n=1 Tax=Caerostris darwini TaxID=1538125 RepID=A0AAV4SKQ4_9ARAC|nr:uncharacterized protein CDAR_41231 [Caerostris darwini]